MHNFRFGARLGLTFSYLLFKQFILDSYYKFSFVGEDGNEIAKVSNTYMGYSDEVRYAPTDLFLMHSFGFNIRHNFYFIGMEYTFKGNVNSKYQLPYVVSNLQYDGTTYITRYEYRTAQVAGRQKISTLYITAGLTWGGGKKWKRLVRKGKWKMDSK